jgi:hypothetical protein
VTDIEITAYIPTIPPGTYRAAVTGLELATSKTDGSHFRRWEFTIEDGRTIKATSSLQTTPNSKAGKWIAALMGGTLPQIGDKVTVIGRRCLISVGLNDQGFERVDAVMADVGAPPRVHNVSESVQNDEGPAVDASSAPKAPDALPF